jgi:hypothetical protein
VAARAASMISAVSMGISCMRHKPRLADDPCLPAGAALECRSMMGGICRALPWRPSQKHNGNRTCTAISQCWARAGRPAGRFIVGPCNSCLLDILVTCR